MKVKSRAYSGEKKTPFSFNWCPQASILSTARLGPGCALATGSAGGDCQRAVPSGAGAAGPGRLAEAVSLAYVARPVLLFSSRLSVFVFIILFEVESTGVC